MRLYILNITKPYSEDEDGYTGEWFDCPVDFEEVKEKLGGQENACIFGWHRLSISCSS